jgi:hypothetical protein
MMVELVDRNEENLLHYEHDDQNEEMILMKVIFDDQNEETILMMVKFVDRNEEMILMMAKSVDRILKMISNDEHNLHRFHYCCWSHLDSQMLFLIEVEDLIVDLV